MIDLSEEPIEENIEICKAYLSRMEKMGMSLEIELGVTGGEEDGVDNTDIDVSKLYTQPEFGSYWPPSSFQRGEASQPCKTHPFLPTDISFSFQNVAHV